MTPSLTRTELLEIAHFDMGREHQPTALMLHGWPDDATTWLAVAQRLSASGIRCIVPWLRGCGATRFLSADTMRDGRTEALAKDALGLMDRLGIEKFAAFGHDWGARTVYALAAVAPERVTRVAALSLGYAPRGEFQVPAFEQSRAWWYQWFMCSDAGEEFVRQHPKAFARMQWDSWSAPGWFDNATFDQVSASFDNPDWIDVTLSSYRSRWTMHPTDARYDDVSEAIATTSRLAVPTLVIHGSADACVLPSSSDGKDRHFAAGYRRVVLDGVGHFVPREAPEQVAALLIDQLT